MYLFPSGYYVSRERKVYHYESEVPITCALCGSGQVIIKAFEYYNLECLICNFLEHRELSYHKELENRG